MDHIIKILFYFNTEVCLKHLYIVNAIKRYVLRILFLNMNIHTHRCIVDCFQDIIR